MTSIASIHNLNIEFRQLTDLLFFSNRNDIDPTKYKELLKNNYKINYDYFIDRFKKSSQIFWESDFWYSRIKFIYSLKNKRISQFLDKKIENDFFKLIKDKSYINFNTDVEAIMFLQYCKVKKENKLPLYKVYNYCWQMPYFLPSKKLIYIINQFIPILYSSIDEYIKSLLKNIDQSSRNIYLLLELEKNGISFDKDMLYSLVNEILSGNTFGSIHRRNFLQALSDPSTIEKLKINYNDHCRNKLITLLRSCNYSELEDNHFQHFKSIIRLDPSLVDDLTFIYLDKLYNRYTSQKVANVNKIKRLVNIIPDISTKKILAWMASNHKNSEIKYLLNIFPELKKLSIFV